MGKKRAALRTALVLAGLVCLAAGDARAQLKGPYLAGFAGLQSGTQPPPGISVILPLYFYTTNDIRDGSGQRLPARPRINFAYTGPGLLWVTNLRILGGNLGGQLLPLAFAKSRIQGDLVQVSNKWAYTDLFVQPIQLGWHPPAADLVASYSLFAPTGKWDLAGEKAGLGAWTNMFQAGATLHLDQQHEWTLSTLGSYEINSYKKDTPIRAGNILTVEGGLGRSFYKFKKVGTTPVPTLVTNVGVIYWGQFKVTGDRAGALEPLLLGRDRGFAAGLEGSVAMLESGLSFDLRVEPGFASRNRTQGWTFLLTAAYQIKSLVKQPSASESQAAPPKR